MDDAQGHAHSKMTERSINHVPPKLLIAEDDEDNRVMLRTALEVQYGYRVIEAEDGMQAVDVALQEQPDLILMDLDMPILNGIEATQRIRLQPQTSHIPILVVSGHLSAADWAMQARDAGSAGHIRKPTEPAAIERKIREVLGQW